MVLKKYQQDVHIYTTNIFREKEVLDATEFISGQTTVSRALINDVGEVIPHIERVIVVAFDLKGTAYVGQSQIISDKSVESYRIAETLADGEGMTVVEMYGMQSERLSEVITYHNRRKRTLQSYKNEALNDHDTMHGVPEKFLNAHAMEAAVFPLRFE